MQQTKDSKDKEKIRVFALARNLGVDSKTVIDLCKGLGFDVKSQLSSLEPEQVEQLKHRMTKGSSKPTAPVEAPRTPAVAPVVKDRKIVNLAPPKPQVRPEPKAEPEPSRVGESAPEALTPEATPAAEAPVAPPVPVAEAHSPAPAVSIRPAELPRVESVTPEPAVPAPQVIAHPSEAEPVSETPKVAASKEPVLAPAAEQSAPVADPTVSTASPTAPKPTAASPSSSRSPTVGTRMVNLSGSSRPPMVRPGVPPKTAPASTEAPPVAKAATPTPTPPPAPPRPVGPASGMPANPPRGPGSPPQQAGQRPTGQPGTRPPGPIPRPGSGPMPPRPGPASLRPGGGAPPDLRGRPPAPTPGPGGAPGTGENIRKRLDERGRRQQLTERQRPGDPNKKPAGPLPPPPPKQRSFTPDELKALRDGTTLAEILRKKKEETAAPPVTPGGPSKGPSGDGGEVDPDSEEGRKKKAAAGRSTPHADRAKRQEQRKVRQTSIVIQGGQVDLTEEQFGSKRGRRPKLIKKKQQSTLPPKDSTILISPPITVRSLSEAIGMKVGELVLKLKQLTTTLYTVNSSLDFDVAELIATEKNLVLQLSKSKSAEDDVYDTHKEAQGDESKLEARAPVVTIMGHVDHGKTSLLDKIRASNVVDTEAGGITQVIRAWRVEHNGKPITFLDTPGHEAFTKMRARGANVTDIAVIVVAANDGVMPQTEEAIAHAKAAGVSIVVAINKIDLPDANIKRTEQQLYSLNLLPDTMGGDCQFVYTSAAKGTGIDELLETLSLVAELKELKANPHKPAMGVCLEAHLSGEEGVMATVLVQQGTLHPGNVLICGATYGRVRAMYDDFGRQVQEAGPSMPVRISGLDNVPNADDHFHAVPELSKAREIAEKRRVRAQESLFKPRESIRLEHITEAGKPKITELKVILKAEARGSVEAIRKELEKLVHDEVRVRLLHAGIGAITESDVQLALASPEDSLVVGFNVVPDDNAMRLAESRDVKIREYDIIYKLTEDIKSALEGKLKPREEIVHLGRAYVRMTFKVGRVGTIAGCAVTQGTIERSAKIRVIRDGVVVYPVGEKTASLESLKHHKDDVREIKQGFECGMKIANYDDIKVGDVIEAYRIDHVLRTL